MRHSCISSFQKRFQQDEEKKQKVQVMRQFQPPYTLQLKLQHTHRRPRCENVGYFSKAGGGERGDGDRKVRLLLCAMICLTHFKSGCVSQVMQGRGGPRCWNTAQTTETWHEPGWNNQTLRLRLEEGCLSLRQPAESCEGCEKNYLKGKVTVTNSCVGRLAVKISTTGSKYIIILPSICSV